MVVVLLSCCCILICLCSCNVVVVGCDIAVVGVDVIVAALCRYGVMDVLLACFCDCFILPLMLLLLSFR